MHSHLSTDASRVQRESCGDCLSQSRASHALGIIFTTCEEHTFAGSSRRQRGPSFPPYSKMTNIRATTEADTPPSARRIDLSHFAPADDDRVQLKLRPHRISRLSMALQSTQATVQRRRSPLPSSSGLDESFLPSPASARPPFSL